MLYYLLPEWAEWLGVLNVFRYITFRTAGAMLTALILSFWIASPLIRWLKSKQGEGQPIREEIREQHASKQGTPTMGGLMMLLTLTVSTILWADLSNGYVWIVLVVAIGFGAIGLSDDYLKLTRGNWRGLSARSKLLLQGLLAAAAAWTALWLSSGASELYFPVFKQWFIDLGWFFVPFAIVVMVGTSNAVNLTDGLDGLVIVPVMMVAGCFGVIAYVSGHNFFADYLQIRYIPLSGELAVVCGGLIGTGLGFLWYNAPPAKVFMGDTGSLAIGGTLGAIAVLTKHEIVLAITGGLFVLEALSVIVQVTSYKLTGRRVFKMAPLHHHFEQQGWSETTIVVRFWIIAAILALIGLMTLKLR